MALVDLAQAWQNLITVIVIVTVFYLLYNNLKDKVVKDKINDAWDKIKYERTK